MSNPTFVIHMHDRDGDVSQEGIYLCFGSEAFVRVANDPEDFKLFCSRIVRMQSEIEEVYDDG